MKNISFRLLNEVFIFVASLLLLAPYARGATIPVDCGSGGNGVGAAIQSANPGDTVSVTGSCNENVLIKNEKQRVIIDGGGSASITAASGIIWTVRGKGILIQGFTITGGDNGISVERGSNAVINNNTIQSATNRGILVRELAFAVIKNNTIQNNGSDGILVSETSTARIGFDHDGETSASPNLVQNNGGRGIHLQRGSSARIYGNTIQNNGSDGVGVFRLSHADLSSNVINGNGTVFVPGDNDGNGISTAQNSSVQLGEDNPVDFSDQPNTTTVKNANFGIRCAAGANVRGHLGSSNPLDGNTSQFGPNANAFSGNCPTAATSLSVP